MPRPCAVEFHARRYQQKLHNFLRCHGLAPWSLTLAATNKSCTTFLDATALRRGVSRSPLQRKPPNSPRCHGLAPWSLTLAATKKAPQLSQMPRPCPVESHASSYKESPPTLPDATALPRGVSRSPLQTKA